MFRFLSKKRTGGNRQSQPVLKKTQRRNTQPCPSLEVLEDRICLTVETVFLDFNTPLSGSVPQLSTSFGSVQLTGNYESVIIDSDLLANGMGGQVLANVPTSQDTGYGKIELFGGLGKSIKFFYGTRNEVTSPAVQGGFTGFTYTRSLEEQLAPLSGQPEDVFKQFALGFGQPYGPQTLDGPVLGPATVVLGVSDPTNNYAIVGTQDKTLPSDGQGLFNSFSWTSGTFAGNVFAPSRPGSSQLDNVEIQVLPATDILQGSVRPLKYANGVMQAQFAPLDDQGNPVPLKDLARALGVDHFNWRQTILAVPDSPAVFLIQDVPPGVRLNDVLTKNISGPIDAPVYSDGTPVTVTRITPGILGAGLLDPLDRADVYYAGYSETQGWVPLPMNGQANDEYEPYLSETGQPGISWQSQLVDAQGNPSEYSLMFFDKPRIDKNAFTGQQPYMQFKTELVGVKADGSIVSWEDLGLGTAFKWKTNAKSIDDVTVFGVIGDSNPDVESDGVFDVFLNDGSLPNAPPVARNDFATTAALTSVEVPILANDDNPDFGSLDLGSVVIAENPANGTVTYNANTGVVLYIPNAGFTGTETFKYTVRDDKGALSNEADVTIQVVQAPVAVDDSASTQGVTPIAVDVLSNDSAPDGTLDPTSVTVGTGPANGLVSVDSTTGKILYSPNAGFFGTDTFTYTVKDDNGSVSNEATVTVNVASPSSPPPSVTDVRVRFGSQSYSLLGNNRTLPWTNITSIDIVFDQDVVIDQNALQLAGVNVGQYGGTFSYNAATHTATWTLASPIKSDRLTLSLDGDGATGDGNDGIRTADGVFLQGGDYILGFNVLAGDYNGDGVVTIQDSVAVRNHSPGYGLYDIFADLDGDGDVDLNDINAPRQRLGLKLP